MRIKQVIIIPIVLLAFLAACRSKQDGAIEGTITAPADGARITAMRDGKEALAVVPGGRDGSFRLLLPAGRYTISVTAQAAPDPLRFDDIIVNPGATTTLPPIVLAPPAGKAVLRGRLSPPVPNAKIELLSGGKERASVRVDQEGNYEFKELPAGTYTVRANAPGHADDQLPVVLSEDQRVERNAVLIPISDVDGVDWASGRIRAKGVGMPPRDAANSTIRREMAKRAALADAQRNLLGTIEQIRVDAHRTVKTAMQSAGVAKRIQGFVKGYTVASERDLDNGAVEVILELPLTGAQGLSHALAE